MKRFPSLKKKHEFQDIYRTGKSFANKYLVMYVKRGELKGIKIGISVSKKVGNSVVRHRLSRLIREIFRLNQSQLEDGVTIIVVARVSANKADYKKLENSFIHLCGLHHILKGSK